MQITLSNRQNNSPTNNGLIPDRRYQVAQNHMSLCSFWNCFKNNYSVINGISNITPCHHLYSITKERGLLHSYTEDGIIIFQPVAEKFQYNYQYICPRHLCTRLWAEKFLENPSKLINYQSKSSKPVCNGQRKAGYTVKSSVQEQWNSVPWAEKNNKSRNTMLDKSRNLLQNIRIEICILNKEAWNRRSACL